MTSSETQHRARVRVEQASHWYSADLDWARSEGGAVWTSSIDPAESAGSEPSEPAAAAVIPAGPGEWLHVYGDGRSVCFVDDHALYLADPACTPASAAVCRGIDGTRGSDDETVAHIEIHCGFLLTWTLEAFLDELPSSAQAPPAGDYGDGRAAIVSLPRGVYRVSYAAPVIRDKSSGVELDEMTWVRPVDA